MARAFNLTGEELRSRIVSAWVAGQPIQFEDRRWDPSRAKLTIYEARELAGDEIGMGRGWGTVSREGEDVTERVLEAARSANRSPAGVDRLKAEILAAAAPRLNLEFVLDLAARAQPDVGATERVNLAKRAVLELLEDGSLELSRPG